MNNVIRPRLRPGTKWESLISIIKEVGLDESYEVLKNKEVFNLMSYLKLDKPVSVNEISTKSGRPIDYILQKVEELKENGYNIVQKGWFLERSSMINKRPEDIIKVGDSKKYRFGLTSDNHLGSKYARLDVVHSLYDYFEEKEIDTVFNTGNWIEGEAKFNTFDIDVHGFDNQINFFLENFPVREGIKTIMITGDDHEGWYTKSFGIDVGKRMQQDALSKGRTDLVYVGHMEHDVIIDTPAGPIKIRLLHPGGGTGYATSYQPQKIIESYTGGEKPHVLLIGHYHKANYEFIRGVHCIQSGCFTGNTNILTENGYKKIRDIKVGDLVMTHNNRLRKVIRTYPVRYANDFWRLNYGRKGRFDQTLTATSEHPILIERNGKKDWVPIKEVIPGDFIFVTPNKCEITGEVIPYWLKLSKNANPMHKKEVRDKLSKTKGGFKKVRASSGSGFIHMKNDIIPFCEEMKKEGWKIVPVGADVIPDAVGFKDGKIVLFELEKRKGKTLEFKQNKYKDNTINNFIDEVRWIDLSENKEQPRPFYEEDVSGFVKVEVLSCEAVDISERKRKTEKVYNFEVEEDNSYVAGNVVVHNCTQEQSTFMRKKRLAAHLGGWIFEFTVDDNGFIDTFSTEFIPFYNKEKHLTQWKYQW